MQCKIRNFEKPNLTCVDQSTLAVLITWFLQPRYWFLIRESYCAILEPVLEAYSKMTTIFNPEQNLPGVFKAKDFSKKMLSVHKSLQQKFQQNKKHFHMIWLLASKAKDFHFVVVIQYNKWRIRTAFFATRIKLFHNTFLLFLQTACAYLC